MTEKNVIVREDTNIRRRTADIQVRDIGIANSVY